MSGNRNMCFGMDDNQPDPKRQLQGKLSKAKGANFEKRLEDAFSYYERKGVALIEKTPEPLRTTKALGAGKFEAFFVKKAQPDYKGTVRGGHSVLLEAKYTEKDRIEKSRVLDNQEESLTKHQMLGARCYVIIGFSSGDVYRMPWSDWKNMKELFGHKYITEKEAKEKKYQIEIKDGILRILE